MNKEPVPQIEWQTIGLMIANYSVFGLMCLHYHSLPVWIVATVGAMVVCLHGSLQHEVIHGHPTRTQWFNEWLVFPSLGLWLPYGVYRETHLKHHIDEYITDPYEDPESYYVAGVAWSCAGPLKRRCLLWRNTLAGRLLAGPLWVVTVLLKTEGSAIFNGNYKHLGFWGWHLLSLAIVISWLNYCAIPLFEYILLCAYPGLSLTLLRSFLEHQAEVDPARRTAVVESGTLMGLLFLNNNLHALHHEKPGMPWYRLPAEYRQQAKAILSRNGGYYYRGYLKIIRRYLLSPRSHPRHPFV